MLAGAGFGDDPGLAHAQREQDLADAIVDLVGAGMVELVALEPDLRALACGSGFADMVGQPFGIIERAGAADIMFEQVVELFLERRIGLCRAIMFFQIEDQRHQRLGDIAAAEFAEMAAIIGLVAIAVGGQVVHGFDYIRSC